jgi:hypothetical protein
MAELISLNKNIFESYLIKNNLRDTRISIPSMDRKAMLKNVLYYV